MGALLLARSNWPWSYRLTRMPDTRRWTCTAGWRSVHSGGKIREPSLLLWHSSLTVVGLLVGR